MAGVPIHPLPNPFPPPPAAPAPAMPPTGPDVVREVTWPDTVKRARREYGNVAATDAVVEDAVLCEADTTTSLLLEVRHQADRLRHIFLVKYFKKSNK